MKHNKLNEFFNSIGFNPNKIIQLMIMGAMLIIIFSTCFGVNNIILSIPFIISIPYLKTRDFSKKKIKKLLIILGITLSITILSTLAYVNIYVGIVINFITIFSVAFIFTAKYKASLYLPIIYYFVYSEVFPIPADKFKLRIGAAVFGSIYILVVLIILSRKKSDKWTKLLNEATELTKNQIENVINNKYDEKIYKKNKGLLDNISKLINIEKNKNYYNESLNPINLNLVAINKGINTILKERYYINKSKNNDYINNFLDDLKDLFNNIIKYNKQEINKKEYNSSIEGLIKKYEESSINEYIVFQIVQLIKVKNGNEEKSIEIKNRKNTNEVLMISGKKSIIPTLKSRFNFKSINFRFALRLSIVLTLSLFISNYFDVSKLYWIPISVMTVTQPFFEDTFSKACLRFKGTIIGSVIVFIILSFPIDNSIKIIIYIISIVISFGFTKYDKMVALCTVGTVIYASITMGEYVPLIDRILYVSIGVTMAIIANKIILPYKINNAIEEYIDTVLDIDIELINKVQLNMLGENNWSYIKKILSHYNVVSDKINLYNTKLQLENIDNFILYNSVFINDILYNLYYYNNHNVISNIELLKFFDEYLIKSLNGIKNKSEDYIIHSKISSELEYLFSKVKLKENKIVAKNLSNAIATIPYIKENYNIINWG